nr:aminotransferase class V-fold PLP-dependent enzyme [Propionibacterium sp.]
MLYLDNAATSWPKPPGVAEAMTAFLADVGANPGRSGHRRAVEAARLVFDAREGIAELVGASDPLRVVFGANATEALNLALVGLLRPGDRVLCSSMEHNAVMRPLRALEQRGVGVDVVACSSTGELAVADVEAAMRPRTRVIVLTHASNVTGTILPVAAVGRLARDRGLLFCVDAAQTAGAVPIDVVADGIDLLAFTGHKGLLGPMGTGGLVLGDRVDPATLPPLKRGGTGSRSSEELQPDFLPDKYEAGTPNVVGLAGLAAAVRWVLDRGVADVRRHEIALTRRLLTGLAGIEGVTVHGPGDAERQTATVSFTLAGRDPAEVGLLLEEEHDVLCRVGLHCAPAAHRTLGTFPSGTIRFAPGVFTTAEDVDRAVAAVRSIAGGTR